MELIEVTFQTSYLCIAMHCSVSGFRPEDNWEWKVKQERVEVKIFRKGIVGGKNLGSKACCWVGLGGKTRGEHSLASSTGASLPSSQVTGVPLPNYIGIFASNMMAAKKSTLKNFNHMMVILKNTFQDSVSSDMMIIIKSTFQESVSSVG